MRLRIRGGGAGLFGDLPNNADSGGLECVTPVLRAIGIGDAPCLICLKPLAEAQRDLERVRQRYARAALVLTLAREKLDQVVEQAFAQRRFSAIEALFREEEEEEALETYERSAADLARAEGRLRLLRAALAHEQALALMGPMPRRRMH